MCSCACFTLSRKGHLYPVKHNREQAVPTLPILHYIHSLPQAGSTPCLKRQRPATIDVTAQSQHMLLQGPPAAASASKYPALWMPSARLQCVEPDFKETLELEIHSSLYHFASLFCGVLFYFSSPKEQQNTRTRCLHRAGGAVKALLLLYVFFPGSWKNRAGPTHHSDETLTNVCFAKA